MTSSEDDDFGLGQLDLDVMLSAWSVLSHAVDQEPPERSEDDPATLRPASLALRRARAFLEANSVGFDDSDDSAPVIELGSPSTVERTRRSFSSHPHSDQPDGAIIIELPLPSGQLLETATDQGRLDRFLQRFADRKRSRAGSAWIGSRAGDWTWIGMAISAMIAVAVATEAWAIAVLLLVTRICGSLWIGGGPSALQPPISANAEEGSSPYRSPSRAVWGCFTSHACDGAIIIACGIAIVRSHPAVAFVAPVATAFMLVGTLARVAPAQVAVVVRRSSYERVVRLGGMLAGFVAGAVLGNQPAAAVLLAVAPSGLFGLWELVRMLSTVHSYEIASLYVAGFGRDGARITEHTYGRLPTTDSADSNAGRLRCGTT
jgi:hypothetical protein